MSLLISRFVVSVGLALIASFASAQIPLMVQPLQLPDPLENLRRAEEIRAMQLRNAEAERRLRMESERQQQALRDEENRRRQEEAARRNVAASVPPANPPMNPDLATWLKNAEPRMHLYPDFREVVFAENLSITNDMVRLMAGSRFAADIAYYLGKNRAQAVAISQMPLLDAAKAIDQIEARFR